MCHSFIPLACAECDDSLPFSGASSIPLCYVLFPATLLHHLFFHNLSPHLAIYFLVNLSILLFPKSYIIPFWEFYFLPFSVHAQTNVICYMHHNVQTQNLCTSTTQHIYLRVIFGSYKKIVDSYAIKRPVHLIATYCVHYDVHIL